MDPTLGFLVLILIVILALLFDYVNGFHDAANAIATLVSSKALPPKQAVIYGAILNFSGALMGEEVAATIGKGLVDQTDVTLPVILVALVAGICWNVLTWYLGLPTSSSHALMGSLLGAAFFASPTGKDHIHWVNFFEKVIQPMFGSPLLGLMLGFLMMTFLAWMFFRVKLNTVNRVFKKSQLVSSGFLAISHGMNDAQKSMGIIALALVIFYHIPASEFSVPLWVKIACATMMGLGTLTGGWKIIHTLSKKMIRLQPIYGFAAEATSASIILLASQFGIPLSTTQVISSSIMGVGATKRLSAVKWGIVQNILWAWVLTIPLTFLFAGLLIYVFKLFF
ncbi:MAG: inorganic phosphate transporter [Vampirovibrionales bacterium]|nr:inorganic phosphate transporter [Vampirovibrionales bacterium]